MVKRSKLNVVVTSEPAGSLANCSIMVVSDGGGGGGGGDWELCCQRTLFVRIVVECWDFKVFSGNAIRDSQVMLHQKR